MNEKPSFPEHASSWWHLKVSELTEEQAQIRREYLRAYRKWRRANKDYKHESKTPAWFLLPVSQLSKEQLRIKHEYYSTNYANNKEAIASRHRQYTKYARECINRIKEIDATKNV